MANILLLGGGFGGVVAAEALAKEWGYEHLSFVASPLWPSISMPTDASEFVLVGKVVAYFAVERFFQRVS